MQEFKNIDELVETVIEIWRKNQPNEELDVPIMIASSIDIPDTTPTVMAESLLELIPQHTNLNATGPLVVSKFTESMTDVGFFHGNVFYFARIKLKEVNENELVE